MAELLDEICRRNKANASDAARDLGRGWKVNPYIIIDPKQTITLTEIEGPMPGCTR